MLIDIVAAYGGYGRTMDGTVTVYEYETFDSRRRRWLKADRMATAAAIERQGGVMFRLTALVVDASRVDELGMLKPPRSANPVEEAERDSIQDALPLEQTADSSPAPRK